MVPVATSCRALGVSLSWFYKHRGRPLTVREQRRENLDGAIERVFAANDGEYGSPRVRAELAEEDPEIWGRLSVNTVAQRMQVRGLRAKRRPRGRSLTRPDKRAPVFENLLNRDFKPAAPNVSLVRRHNRDSDVGGTAVPGERGRSVQAAA